MIQPSNTPPDGDFVAYVERLTRAPTGSVQRDDLIGNRGDSPLGTPFAAGSGASSVQPPSQLWSARSMLTHLKWVAAAWIASQLLAKVAHGADFLFIPAVVVYASWVILRHNRHSQGAVAKRIRELASQALAQAKVARRTTKK